MAGIITSQNTRRPLSSATATQDYRNAVYKQVDRSCVPHCRHREGGKEGGKGRGEGKKKSWERWKGKEGRDQKVRESSGKKTRQGPVYPQGPNHNYSHAEIVDICISMTQIMFAWTWKDCKKSKVGEVWWMSDWSLPPQSFLLYQRGLAFLSSCDGNESHTNTHIKVFYKNMTPLLVQRRTSPLWSYCLHANILLSILSTFVAPQGAGTS